MDNSQAINEFLGQEVCKDVVMKYIFIKSIEESYDDEYIYKMYGLRPLMIKERYKSLEKDERVKMEKNIREKIEAGEIDLSQEAEKWNRKKLKAERRREISSKRNINEKNIGEER